MKPVRLTREQSRDQTRQRLLDAAQAVFTKKGFGASSVEDVAADAGYTRGAFYSNFSSKAELLLEVLKRDHDTIMQRLSTIFEDGEASRADMEARLQQLRPLLAPSGFIWVSWPKKASKVPTDITEDGIRDVILLDTDLVDVKVCAVDAIWSGLKLMIRRDRR